MKQVLINQLKGLPFSSFVFQLTIKDDPLLPRFLETMNETSQIRKRVEAPIEFMPALVMHKGEPSIFPNTISLIQGQSGVHKSDLAQLICACLIKNPNSTNCLLDFEVNDKIKDIHVLYIDTERNLADQFPFAMQKILVQAGYHISDNPSNLHYLSFLSTPRKERPDFLNMWLSYYTSQKLGHLVVVLDVSTDFIEDFNSVNDTMKLSDLMNNLINHHKVTFICVIHENPGSEKARGHYGTEMLNKATTIIQVSEEKHKVNERQLYQLKYLKNRNTKRLPSIHFDYDERTKSLVEVDEDTLKALKDSHKMKANNAQMAEALRVIFQSEEKIMRQQLLIELQNELNIKERSAIDRLTEFYENENTVLINERTFILSRTNVGNSHQYYLKETNS